jgi:hypothetical protein
VLNKGLSVFVVFALILSLFSVTALGKSDKQDGDKKGNTKENQNIVEEFDVNGKKVKVKISKKHRELVSEENLRELAEEFPDGAIHVYNVSDVAPTPNYEFESEQNHSHASDGTSGGEIGIQSAECSYYGLCKAHSHYYVTSNTKTSYGHNGPTKWVESVAKGAEKTVTQTITRTQSSTVSGGVSALQAEISASINKSTSKSYTVGHVFTGKDIVAPYNSRDFYWRGVYDAGTEHLMSTIVTWNGQ